MDKMKGKCKVGNYTTNKVVLHGAIVCSGGFGVDRCQYYQECLANCGIKLSKNGRRIRIKIKEV